MHQKLVKNLVFILVVNILVKAVWIFLIDRNVQIRVGYENYGAFQALFNLGMIFQIVLDFGLTPYTSREIASNPNRIGSIFSSMLWARILLSLVYSIVVVVVALLLDYKMEQITLLIAVLGILSLNSMLVFLRSNIAALHFFKTDGVLAVIDRLLMIVVCGALLIIPSCAKNFRIEWFVWSQIACYALAVMIAFFVLFKLTPVSIRFTFESKVILRILKQSSPYALLVFMMAIYMRSDSVMIERLCGDEGKMQAGIYASAFRLLDVANIFGVMFAGMLLPIFSKMFAQKESVATTVRTCVNIMMPLSFITAIVSMFFGSEIMEFLYHKSSTQHDGKIFSLLMWSFPAYCLMYIYSTLLTAKGSICLLNKLSIFVVIINLILHYLLISQFKAIGAAYTVLVSEWLVAMLVVLYAHKQCSLPHNYRWLMGHLGFVLCLLAAAFFSYNLILEWTTRIFILIGVSLLLLFFFRFWSIQSIKALLQRKSD